MFVTYDALAAESKVIIFPGSRKFFPVELPKFEQNLKDFCENLSDIEISFQIKYNRFLIFLISDKTPLDLDKHNVLVEFVQQLEQEFNLILLDKVNVCFKQGPYVQMKEIPDFKVLIKNKGVSKNTVVFDHMINTKYEYEDSWEIPAGESWLSHFF